jgi:hypothetical protein
MTLRLAIRGFANGMKQFEDRVDVDVRALDQVIPDLATKHGRAMAEHRLHMIEIEFLDEPNELERYFRFGTDTRGMVRPIQVNL